MLFGDPRIQRAAKERLIRGFAHALRNETDCIFGPDMGTDETCMAWVKDEIGRAVGLPRELGGIPLDELGAPGWGLAHAADIAARHCNVALLPDAPKRLPRQMIHQLGKHQLAYP